MVELNIIRKRISGKTPRLVYLYPNIYEAMVGSLSSHIIYYMINEEFPEVYLERTCFMGRNAPHRSLETSSPLRDYEFIITSLHYEPDIAKLIMILHGSGIDPRRSNRGQIVVAGGPAIMSNPMPYSELVDVAIIGEAEVTLPIVIEKWLEFRFDKKRFLEEVSELPFTYVPSIDEPDDKVYRRYTEDLDSAFFPIRQFRSTEKQHPFGEGFMIETSRGCRYWCRFCVESRLFKPYRSRSFARLKEIIDQGLRVNDLKRVIIYSLLFPSNNVEKQVLQYVVDQGFSASIPSLRLDHLDADLLDLIRRSGQKSIAVAPESLNPITQRMIAKYIDVSLAMDAIYMALEHGFDLKLYLIYGFKSEKISDVKILIDALKRVADKAKASRTRIKISLNPLIPKPHTVFQWIGMIDLQKAREILRYIKNELPGYIETRQYEINQAWIQASISLGDSSITKVLLYWGVEGGGLGSWRRAIERTGYSTKYVFEGYRFGGTLPWSNIVIDDQLDKILRAEYVVWQRIART